MSVEDYITSVFEKLYPSKPIEDTYTDLCIYKEGKITFIEYSPFGDPVWLYLCLYTEDDKQMFCEICRSEIDFTPYTGQWLEAKIVENDRTKKKSLILKPHISPPRTAEYKEDIRELMTFLRRDRK